MTKASKDERPWIASEIVAYARHEGITLTVPRDEDTIDVSNVKKPLPQGFSAGIKEWKETVMRLTLRQQAYAYLDERWVKGANEKALEPVFVDLWEAKTMDEFRQKIRTYVQTGLKEIARVKALTDQKAK